MVYLLRVPATTAIVLMVLPLASLVWVPSILGGIFDNSPWHMLLVAATAGMLAYTITTTAGLVLAYGHLRSDVPPIGMRPPGATGVYGERSLVLALPVLVGIVVEAHQNQIRGAPPPYLALSGAGVG